MGRGNGPGKLGTTIENTRAPRFFSRRKARSRPPKRVFFSEGLSNNASVSKKGRFFHFFLTDEPDTSDTSSLIVLLQPGFVPERDSHQYRPVIRRYYDPINGWQYYTEYAY
jgi:hypothetical protein